MLFKNKPHSVRKSLEVAVSFLLEQGIETAKIDASLLLQHILNIDKTKLLLILSEEITENALMEFEEALLQRAKGVPLQYITEQQEFMSLPFKVTPDVLIPRPETELLVEKAIEYIKKLPYPPKIVDVCTGSGCIIISICYYVKKGIFLAGDISGSALEIARYNAQQNAVDKKINFLQADLLENPEFAEADIILSNPPYIASAEIPTLQREVSLHEPHIALDGGDDGLVVYRRLIPQAFKNLKVGGWLYVEIGWDQGQAIIELFILYGFEDVKITKDYAGNDRIISGRKPVTLNLKPNLLWDIFWTFLKIGSFTIGGGYAMVPVIERVLAEEKGYLTKDEFLERLIIAQTAPGVLATNISVAVGYKIYGSAGALAAAFGASLPAFAIIIFILKFLKQFENNHLVKAFFSGAEPVIVILLITAAWSMGKKAIHGKIAWLLGICAFILVVFLKINPIFAIVLGGIAGILFYRSNL